MRAEKKICKKTEKDVFQSQIHFKANQSSSGLFSLSFVLSSFEFILSFASYSLIRKAGGGLVFRGKPRLERQQTGRLTDGRVTV